MALQTSVDNQTEITHRWRFGQEFVQLKKGKFLHKPNHGNKFSEHIVLLGNTCASARKWLDCLYSSATYKPNGGL